MFPSLKHKFKARNRILATGLLAIAVVFSAYSELGNIPVAGQTADQLQSQKNAAQQRLNEVNKKIADFQSQINQKAAVAKSLSSQINLLDLEIAQTEAQIEATMAKIDVTNLEIADVTNNIIQTEKEIEKNKEVLRQLISQIHELDQMSPLEVALENDNFVDFLNQLQYNTNVQEQSQESLTKIKKLRAELEQRNAELKKEKADLDDLQQELEVTQANLSGQRKAKSDVLAETRGQEKIYQQLLASQKSALKELQDEIYNLDAQISAKLGNRKLPPKKGLFMWPMEGTLTQGYGNTGFTSLGYSFHNGIDVAAPAGRQIYAAFDGTVEDTGTGQGAYGNWVTIRHTVAGGRQLISLYGHMSSFKVAKGQAIKQGDLVGFEGNTGNTTRLLYGPHRGYHLHFTVFDAEGYGVANGTLVKQFGAYRVPYGATYNPLDFL